MRKFGTFFRAAGYRLICRECRLVVGGEASVPAKKSGPSPSERRLRVGQRPRTGQGIRRLTVSVMHAVDGDALAGAAWTGEQMLTVGRGLRTTATAVVSPG